MQRTRNIVAALLAILAAPSVLTLLWRGQFGYFVVLEALFVTALLAAAALVLRGSRYWYFWLLGVLLVLTWAFARKFIGDVLLVPEHWTYFGIVLREATKRGLDGGPVMVWSLIVIPLALPAMSVLSVVLCLLSSRRSTR